MQFDRCLKLNFLGNKVAADTVLLAYRKLDEALDLTEMGKEVVADLRFVSNLKKLIGSLSRLDRYGLPAEASQRVDPGHGQFGEQDVR